MTYKFGQEFEVTFPFDSSGSGADILHTGGDYQFFDGNDDFSPGAVTWGTDGSPYGARLLLVLGEDAADDITLRITGNSWDMVAGETVGDTEDLVVPSSAVADDAFQSEKVWTGDITIQKTVGTAKNFNYGWVRAYDNCRRKFWIKGVCITGEGAASDAGADLIVRHHKLTGWTYNAGAEPTPPTPLVQMSSLLTDDDIKNGDPFCLRVVLNTAIAGNNGEGLIFEAVQSVARPFINGTVLYKINMTP